MIVFDLHCMGHGHRFEAWFASSDSYQDQRTRGLVQCPVCGDTAVDKAPMAPRLTRKGNQMSVPAVMVERQDASLPAPAPVTAAMAMPPVPDAAQLAKMVEALAEMQSKALENSVYVGDQFADQARAIHYGEADQAIIHGTTSKQEAEALLEEGIPVAPLPFPIVPPEAKN